MNLLVTSFLAAVVLGVLFVVVFVGLYGAISLTRRGKAHVVRRSATTGRTFEQTLQHLNSTGWHQTGAVADQGDVTFAKGRCQILVSPAVDSRASLSFLGVGCRANEARDIEDALDALFGWVQ